MPVTVFFRCNYIGDFGKAVRTSHFHCFYRFPLYIVTFKKGTAGLLLICDYHLVLLKHCCLDVRRNALVA